MCLFDFSFVLCNADFDCITSLARENRIIIGEPENVQHITHVNKELNWSVRDPATSFQLIEKLGSGYASVQKHAFKSSTHFNYMQVFWCSV